MGIRTKAAVVVALGLAAAGMVAAPASAGIDPLSITNVRTGADPVVAGSNNGTTFKVSVTNQSQSPVGAIVYGKLDAGVAMTAATSSDADCTLVNDTTFYCNTGPAATPTRAANPPPIAGGATIEVDVTVRAYPTTAPGTYTLCSSTELMTGAPANGGGCPPVPPDSPSYPVYKEATATVDVVREADLGVTATDAPQTDPGAQAQTKFQVSNGGPSLPPKIFLNGTLPDGLTYVSAEGSGWTCSANGQDVSCEYVTDGCWWARVCGPKSAASNFHAIPEIAWNLDTAKPGRVSAYRVPVTVSGEDTTNTGGGQTFALVPVTPVQLDVMKTPPSKQFKVGDEVTWTIAVSNTGTIDDAGTVTVTDTLPSELRYLSASGDGWTCSPNGQKVVCNRPSGLAKGATSQILVKTRLTSAGRVTNSVELSSESYMSNMSITGASAVVPVTRRAQKARPLPTTPYRIASRRTLQGQKITTRVRCVPDAAGAAGELRYCAVSRRAGVTRVRVLGDQPVRVIVVQTAPGTSKLRPFARKKVYVVNP